MHLKCLGSSSAGNCYLLTSDSGETLILDCGIPIKEIKKGLNWDITGVVGCVVSHAHNDHNKLGCFTIKAFQVPHNGTRNCGFLVYADEQKFLYMTDYEYCPYNFNRTQINHMLIECNYIKDMLDRNIPNFEHKVRGHAELETVKKFVEMNNSDALQSIILCHLGLDSTDKDRIIAEIQQAAPQANVDVAEQGKSWSLQNPNSCPF